MINERYLLRTDAPAGTFCEMLIIKFPLAFSAESAPIAVTTGSFIEDVYVDLAINPIVAWFSIHSEVLLHERITNEG